MAAATAPTATGPARASFARRLWSLFVLILVLGSWGAAAYVYRELRREQAARAELARAVAELDPRFERFKGAVRDIDRRLSASVFQEVDLSAGGWQLMAGGFYVIDLATAPQGGGLKITGKVINPTSVTHDAAQFSARIGERRATFSLPHVPPAVAQAFEVMIPDAPPAARHAYFALDSSTISFASSTTRKRTAADPVDVDKLLK